MKFRKEDIKKYVRLKTLIYYFPIIAKNYNDLIGQFFINQEDRNAVNQFINFWMVDIYR